MAKNNVSKQSNSDDTNSESSIAAAYHLIYDWMQPSPKQPVYIQVLFFILKLPLLLIILALSPVIILFLFITFVVAL